MGLSIGSIGRTVSAPTTATPTQNPLRFRAREQEESVQTRLPETGTPDTRSRFNAAQENEPTLPSAGFGRDTLSPPGAALETLGRSVRNVRDAIPTLAEQREDIRERVDALRELQDSRGIGRATGDEDDGEAEAAEEAEQVELPRANVALEIADARARAVTRTQSFVSQVNDAAGVALERLAPEQVEEADRSPNGGTVFTFARNEGAPGPQVIDIRI